MTNMSALATPWLGLALIATPLSIWLGIATAMPEFVVGTVAQLVLGALIASAILGTDPSWVRFLSSTGAVLLTFLAGAQLDPALIAAPRAFVVLLLAKMTSKIVGVYPMTQAFGSPRQEGIYTTLMLSTGLTFGSISALFGLTHGIITDAQYSYPIAAVVASAVVPTLVANAFFPPRHLLPRAVEAAPAVGPAPVTTEGEPR